MDMTQLPRAEHEARRATTRGATPSTRAGEPRRSQTLSPTVRAFDRFAARYDAVCDTGLFRRMREQVHAAFAAAFAPGARVLEIGCGSGQDTAFLAARRADVVALDPSAGMIERARARVAAAAPRGSVRFLCCGLDELPQHLAPGVRFDGIVSNFGALNCVPRLDTLGALAASRLDAGGCAMVCLMSRTCLMEMGWFLLRGNLRQAVRRLGPPPVLVNVEGIGVPTHYHRVRDVRATLGPGLALRRVRGLGVVVPPPFLEPRWAGAPAPLRRAFEAVDACVAPFFPFNRLGDHVMMEFQRI
jgi:SAM-dependent methyltransferase